MAKSRSTKDAFQIKPRPNSGLFEIKTDTVGDIPVKLRGTFTTMREAQVAIDTFRRVNFTIPHKAKARNSKKRALSTPAQVNAQRNAVGESKVDASTGNYQASK